MWLDALVDAVRERGDSLVGGTTFNGLPGNFFTMMNQFILDLVYGHFNTDLDAAYFLASTNIAWSRARYLELGGFAAAFSVPGAQDRDFCDAGGCEGGRSSCGRPLGSSTGMARRCVSSSASTSA